MEPPLQPAAALVPPDRRWRRFFALSTALVIFPGLLLAAALHELAGASSPADELIAMRNVVRSAWQADEAGAVQLSGGWLFWTGARAAGMWLDLPDEARVVLRSVRSVAVGVYEWAGSVKAWRPSRCVEEMDRALGGLGWERVAGVLKGERMIVVYHAGADLNRVCVGVLEGGRFIAVRVRGDVASIAQELLARHGGASLARFGG